MFPFNWFPLREGRRLILTSYHRQDCCEFPFNWFPLREGRIIHLFIPERPGQSFHSIGFPCERGGYPYLTLSLSGLQEAFATGREKRIKIQGKHDRKMAETFTEIDIDGSNEFAWFAPICRSGRKRQLRSEP